jgi:hypothetical protein
VNLRVRVRAALGKGHSDPDGEQKRLGNRHFGDHMTAEWNLYIVTVGDTA